MPPRPLDAKAQERRKRMIAIGGGAILLLLLVIQVPRTLKMINKKSSPPPAAQPALPTPSAGSAPAPVSSSQVADTVIAPSPGPGQLISFSRFESKDPFAQQVSAKVASTPAAASAPASGAAPATTTGSTAAPAPTTSTPTSTTPMTTTASTRTPSSLTSAPISVNGVAQTVDVGALFPKKERIFRLVAVTANTATIAIAGGKFEGGASTVTLTMGKALTLMNKNNGRRYELRLLSIS